MHPQDWITLGVGIATVLMSGLTIWAILRGPIKALAVQRKLDEERDVRSRKLWVFKTLMSYRATRLSPQFVQALNMIQLEFDDPGDKPITDAWKELLDHFTDLGNKPWEQRQKDLKADSERANELTAELLLKMGKSLGYDFDKVYIKKGAYYPEWLGDVEAEQHALRKGILGLLAGQNKLPVAIFEEKFAPITVIPQVPAAEPLPKMPKPKALEPPKADAAGE